MTISRRRFMQTASASGTFLLARFQGLALWAAPELSSSCYLNSGAEFAPFIQDFVKQLQPGHDGFLTEQFAAELESILETWQVSLCTSPRNLQAIHRVLAPTLQATALGDATSTPMRTHPPLQSEKMNFPPPTAFHSAAFETILTAYLSPLKTIEVAELQLFGIEMLQAQPLRLRTDIQYDLVGTLDHNRREQRTGAWNVTWEKTATGQWRVSHWFATREARSRLTGPGFVDVTTEWMVGSPSYQAQLQPGLDHWRTILDAASGIDIYGNNGVAAGDFDGDGYDDLYVCQPAGLPNRLYRNRGDGTLEDVTEKAGVGVLDGTSSALFADLNNSGHQDLIVVRTSGPLLYFNRGDGTFTLKPDAFRFATPPQGTFTGLAVADYDGDGLLDVYFCLYSFYEGLSEYQYPRPYYDAQNGPPNFLLKNRGDHQFEDVTARAGLDHNNNRFSFACTWRDYDHNGWPDLFVVNDFGRKSLYKNNGDGTFTDVSAEAGVEDPGEGMSMTWIDYDNDGQDDVYGVNMWEPAGLRVMGQTEFLPAAEEPVRQTYRQDAMGNSLLHNQGNGKFRDVTEAAGVRAGGWNWGSDAWDLDHDGWPDLYVANGFISGPQKDNLSSFFWRQVAAHSLANNGRSRAYEDAWNAINELIRADHSWSGYQRNNCYLNNRNGAFTECAGVLGLDFIDDSRSFALADLNHDGRLEVILKNRTGPQIRVLENQMAPLGLSLAFALRGTKSNRDAIGAVIELETAIGHQQKTLSAGSGFLMQHTKDVFFGLGEARTPVRAVVRWPSGGKQVFENLSPGHRVAIVEGDAACHQTPFREQAPSPLTPVSAKREAAPTETWLVEPISAPGFNLQDGDGKMHSLQDYRGRALALLFWQAECALSQQQLQMLRTQWPAWQRSQVRLLTIRAGGGGATEAGFPFTVLVADGTIRGVYNIFHRYLFDRRRDMELPTTFLIDPEGSVIKVYRGPSAQILEDWQSAPSDAEARLSKALPFPGSYLGKALHHNYFTYGVAFLRYGYPQQALTAFQQAIDHNQSYAAAYYNVGLIYLNQHNLAPARANLQKAADLDSSNANVWNNLGVACSEAADYTSGVNAFEKALALDPSHLLALENLVRIYKAQGRAEDAYSLVLSAVHADPQEAGLHSSLAMLLVERADLVSAKSEFEKAVQLDPGNAEALNGLGVVLMRMGNRSQAMERFEQCRQLAPGYDRPYLNLALMYAKAGDTAKARELLNQFQSTQHDSAAVRKALKELEAVR